MVISIAVILKMLIVESEWCDGLLLLASAFTVSDLTDLGWCLEFAFLVGKEEDK